MGDSPRTGCARRLTLAYMWREQAKTETHILYMLSIWVLGTNYCIPKRWPMGPLQHSLHPPGANL